MIADTFNRPKRWDRAFAENMSDSQVDWILSNPHFNLMDESNFPTTLQLRDIIRNDCRIRVFEKDQLIVHAGAYTNSAFLILSGTSTLVLAPGIDASAWGQKKKKKSSVFSSLFQFLFRNRLPEVRQKVGASELAKENKPRLRNSKDKEKGERQKQKSLMPSIPDLQKRISDAGVDSAEIKVGDIFGESAVLGRTMINNTVVATSRVEVLEIRWQGLRDICKYEAPFKSHIDELYRKRGLYEELLSLPLLSNVPKSEILNLAKQALFEVYGEFEWHRDFQQATKQARNDDDINRIIQAEPLIAEEGDYPDGLLLLRNGFARVSRKINHGHYTLGHLSRGDLFGLKELYDSWQSGSSTTLRCSLRALGYSDVIRIPSDWLEKNIFRASADTEINRALQQCLNDEKKHQFEEAADKQLDRKLTEFLVENRLINGSQTMMIDLERCVRCDDCVTACSNAHDNNPRFTRHGATFDNYMIANACMHCDDPVCMIGCPTGAIHRSQDGVVSINDETCIGCSSCANSCPYDNIRMVPIRDPKGAPYTDDKLKPIVKATKCDLCTDVAGGPACQRACSHDALIRIDVKDIGRLADWVNR